MRVFKLRLHKRVILNPNYPLCARSDAELHPKSFAPFGLTTFCLEALASRGTNLTVWLKKGKKVPVFPFCPRFTSKHAGEPRILYSWFLSPERRFSLPCLLCFKRGIPMVYTYKWCYPRKKKYFFFSRVLDCLCLLLLSSWTKFPFGN